jgi:hypothetical protein
VQDHRSCSHGSLGSFHIKSKESGYSRIAIYDHLADITQGGTDDNAAEVEKKDPSPTKSKQKKMFAAVMVPKTTIQLKAKSVKMCLDSHTHKHLRVIIEALI